MVLEMTKIRRILNSFKFGPLNFAIDEFRNKAWRVTKSVGEGSAPARNEAALDTWQGLKATVYVVGATGGSQASR